MKKLILFLSLATMISSCDCSDIKYDISVKYTNGDTDTITVTGSTCASNYLYFNDGCVYKRYITSTHEAHFQECVVCGVRSFYKIKN